MQEQLTVEDFEKVCSDISAMRLLVAEKKADLSTTQEQLDALERKAMAMLETADKTKYVSEHGTIYTSVFESVAVPKGDNKQAFLNYLKEHGIYDEVITVNSQWLNGWYRKEKEAALEKGDILFNIPGIENPSTSIRLSFRKA